MISLFYQQNYKCIGHVYNIYISFLKISPYLYTNTVLDVTSVCPSVILSVRYRNHFPVVQFQNQAHIWNPHGTGHVFKTIWAPQFFLSLPKAA